MNKVILLFIGLFTFGNNANAQDTLSNSPKNNISVNVGQLVMGEFRFGYERIFKKQTSLGIELAYKPDLGNNMSSNAFYTKGPYWVAESFTGLVGFRRYFKPIKPNGFTLYLESKFMARYGHYQNKFYSMYNPKDHVPSKYTSGTFEVYEGSLAFGIRYQFSSIYMEAYGGVGIRQQNTNEQVKSSCKGCGQDVLLKMSNESAPYIKNVEVVEALKLGLRAGVSF